MTEAVVVEISFWGSLVVEEQLDLYTVFCIMSSWVMLGGLAVSLKIINVRFLNLVSRRPVAHGHSAVIPTFAPEILEDLTFFKPVFPWPLLLFHFALDTVLPAMIVTITRPLKFKPRVVNPVSSSK